MGNKTLARQAIFWMAAVAAGTCGLSGPEAGSVMAPALAKTATAPEPDAAMDDRALIASIQELLTTLGYKAGRADGIIGQYTRHAILAFQRRIGMAADGRPSEALYVRLTRALNQGGRGSRGEKPAKRVGSPKRTATVPTAAIPMDLMDGMAVTLAAAAPAAGRAAAAKPVSPDRVRDVAPPIDREILRGARWSISDSNGASFELLLEPGGHIGGTALAQFWHWERRGGSIRLIFDNQWGGRVVRTGHFIGGRIVGTAEGNGLTWSWKAERLSAKPDRAAWTSTP